MTIKDINPMEFASFLKERIDAHSLGNAEGKAKDSELRVVAGWAARHVFGDDLEGRQAFLRMAGVK